MKFCCVVRRTTNENTIVEVEAVNADEAAGAALEFVNSEDDLHWEISDTETECDPEDDVTLA